MKFAPIAVSVLVLAIGNYANCASQHEKLVGASPPAECQNENGSPLVLFNAPVPQALLERASEQHYEHGLELSASGDKARAEREFRQAVGENPARGQFAQALAELYITEARPNEALEVVRGYTKVCGVTAISYALEAEVLFQQRRLDDALAAIIASLKLHPDYARMHGLRGLILLLKGDPTDGGLELQKAEQLAPNDADIRYFYGLSLDQIGHYVQARDQFLACLMIDPEHRKAWENLGLSYQAVYDYVNAAKAYQQAIERERAAPNPKRGEPFGIYGAMLVEMGEPQQALPVLEEGIAVSPRSLIVNFELGRALLALDRLQQAQHFLLIAEALDPKFAQTHYLLGRLYTRQKQEEKATQEFRRFHELDAQAANRKFTITDR